MSNSHPYLFTDKIRFLQKAVVMHPYKEMFLILKRSDTDFFRPGTWDLPGGNLSFGEKHHDGLKREIFEETSLKVGSVSEVMVVTDYDKKEERYLIVIGSVCRSKSDRVMLSQEHTEYVWITRDEFLSIDPTWAYQEERSLNLSSTHHLRDLVYRTFQKTL